MRKTELIKLKRINATPHMIELAENNKTEKPLKYKTGWNGLWKKDTKYDIMIRCQSRGAILMVCIFEPEEIAKGNKAPTYEIYCNPEGCEYITRICSPDGTERWSSAMADNLDGPMGHTMSNAFWYAGYKARIWQNCGGKDTIKRMLKTEKTGIWGLIEWQRKVKKINTEEKEKRQQAPWDADMALIPDVCPSFPLWMKKECPREHFIFYEYNRKGVTEGYCTHCMKTVPVSGVKHNEWGKCKKCGVPVIYKTSKRIQTLSTSWYSGQIIQRIAGGIVVREYTGYQYYRDRDYTDPHVILDERRRTLIFDNGEIKYYKWDYYKNKKMRWVKTEDYYNWNFYHSDREYALYKKNLAALRKTALKNSTIDKWDKLPADAVRYLREEKGNPAIEKLARIGMFRLASDLIKTAYDNRLLDESATELAKILKLDKARLARLKAMGDKGGNIYHLKWLQYEKAVNRKWKDEMIQDFGDAEFETSAFNFLQVPLSFEKLWNYIKKQTKTSNDSLRQTIRTWEDYLDMAGTAKLNTKSEMIWKPKDLHAAHQEMVFILQQNKLEKQAEELAAKWTEVNGILPRLGKFEYADEKYAIVAPRTILDIVKEGTALQHCVHTCSFYFDRIQKNESYLFFLRRADSREVSWYTLEVEPSGNIRQKRTTGDNQGKDLQEALEFLKKWQQVFKSRMDEEDRAFGIKAEQARLEEYAKLRRDGNKVWHGRLAGQLLADVLENDFLAAI